MKKLGTAEPGEPRPPTERPDLAGEDVCATFGALFDAHAEHLHRYLARRVGVHLADDLVAETFATALRRRHHYDPERAAVRAWLYGIASNILLRHQRDEARGYEALARAASRLESATEDHGARVADRLDAVTRSAQLAGALAELNAGDRDVLLLSSWAGLDQDEIAVALGIPPGTVRSRLHRVRRRLRATAPKGGAR